MLTINTASNEMVGERQRRRVGPYTGSDVGSVSQHLLRQVGAYDRVDPPGEHAGSRPGSRAEFEPGAVERHATAIEGVLDRSGLQRTDVVGAPVGCETVEDLLHSRRIRWAPHFTQGHRPGEATHRMVGAGERLRIGRIGMICEFCQVNVHGSMLSALRLSTAVIADG